MPRPLAVLSVIVLATPLAGCAFPWDDPGEDDGAWPPTGSPPSPTDAPRTRVTFAGVVVDALSGDPVTDATVRLDLASEAPCRKEGIVWNAWELPVDADGRFGPMEQPAPNSPTYRFFLHATSPGYTEEVVYVGPKEAAQAANLTLVLHPRTAVEGRAPPGTLAALTGPGFPRFEAADEEGRFRFEDARTDPAQLVVATAIPHAFRVTPPETVEANATGAGWELQGVVRRDGGSPAEAQVVAWNGTTLASAARTDEVGRFLLPLPPERATLRIEARTLDDAWGGVLALEVNGRPATVETVVVRALC